MSDEIDDLIRRRLQGSIPRHAEGLSALGDTKPAMIRARRQRQMQTGLASVALLAVVGLGSMLTIFTADTPGDNVIADAPDVPIIQAPIAPSPPTTSGDLAVAPPPITAESPIASDETETSLTAGPEQDESKDDPVTEDTAQPDDEPEQDNEPDSPSSTSPPTTNAQTDEQGSSTVAPTTSNASTERTLRSNCGTVIVEAEGTNVSLVETNPLSGYSTDVKNDGPESIEVSFDGSRGHCELHAEFEDGELEIKISNE